MKLILHLVGPPRLMGARLRCELDAGSVSLGRSPEADWVIPDSERLISRIHLRIDASHGAFVLTDTSVNGVYVNGSAEAVGYGTSVELRDGDALRVGEAQIAVEIAASGPPAASAGLFPFHAQAFVAQIQHAVPTPAAPPPHDHLGGPFGPAPAAERIAPRTVIDANWMTTPIARPPSPAPPPVRPEGAGSGALTLRPLLRSPLDGAGGHASAPRSVQALVKARPDLTPQRLAAAIDAAGQDLDAEAWQALYRRFQSFLDIEN
ncbi:FHA domain-containing protein [Methylobacterium sp. E-016]|uniref:FHA domain-containing protein n=1 Tax=Methylobacterium sp. E-016 TaxID=2836556 RepID=UPI001FB9AF0A|nr:FHA domain-containing protein [Methylobacterium sp. E-016]MCJ2077072.1 FHA domain-containing protein [Methylobacterium sp. E-016]